MAALILGTLPRVSVSVSRISHQLEGQGAAAGPGSATCGTHAPCELSSSFSPSQGKLFARQTTPPGRPETRQVAVCPRAARGPPKQGRGMNARRPAGEGLQKGKTAGERGYEGWTQVAEASELAEGTNKAIIEAGKGYVLVPAGGEAMYTIDANCTSCQFPVSKSENGDLRFGCPLCQSKFFLETGDVAEWSPKSAGPVQWIIGTLKSKAPPVNTKVYPTRVSKSGKVYAQLKPKDSPPPVV
eukprot:jgi/Mesen1/3816/ME000207S02828